MIEQSYQPFAIEQRTLDQWEKRPHAHNFFELVFIEEGRGSQCINRHRYCYCPGSIFLLPPLDCHSFRIEEPTRFVFIRFTGQFFGKGEAGSIDYSEWFHQLHYILSSYNKIPGEIIRREGDKTHLQLLIRGILKEHETGDAYSRNILRSNMVSVLNILTRNVEQILIHSVPGERSLGQILSFIQHHLHDREQLKLDALARRFHIAPSYFGEYFKRNTGESLQDYIIKSRLKIAEARIVHARKSLKETALELGFTDSSHLAKMLKKYGTRLPRKRAVPAA
ncbi:MAG TPA: AraC family transcriptional regulator [Chitinophagaceae bacterium]|nr:AraC family transcriptional regulator [Chitinophagaceae bacterium]